jgi:hypothetical protein
MNETTQPGPLEVRWSDQLGAVSVRTVRGSVADQCRALGLKVGDTIEGMVGGHGWWNTTRLTLLWLGETEAAWRVTGRSSSHSFLVGQHVAFVVLNGPLYERDRPS